MSFTVPVVTTPKPATSVQLRVIWPLASWSQKVHSSREGVVKDIGVVVDCIVDVGVVVDCVVDVSEGSGVGAGSGFCIFPSIQPDNPFDPRSWVMLVFHCSKLFLLNFCSSESMVSEGIPDMIVQAGIFELYFTVMGLACQLIYFRRRHQGP